MPLALCFVVLVFTLLCGCGAILGVDFSGAILGAEGGLDAPSTNDQEALPPDDGPATMTDARADAAVDAGQDARGVCDYPVAPPMVPVVTTSAGTFCVDSTEVTQADYAAFLAAKNGDTSGQIAECTANTFAPSTGCFDPTTQGNYPVACVTWCDAVGYCSWAGKHLCGHVGGGAFVLQSSDVNTKVDEWYMACSHGDDGLHAYPYGTTAQPGLCNDATRDAGRALPVASSAGCVGGYDGVFDMSGNLDEWTFDCKPDHSYCGVRGGRYTNSPAPCGRQPEFGVPPTLMDPLIGFRCCANTLQ